MPTTYSFMTATYSAFPLSVAAHSILKNSEFLDPFTGDSATGWQSSNAFEWQNSGFVKISCNSTNEFNTPYLYQEITTADPMAVGANYEIRVGVRNFVQTNGANPGRLTCQMTNGYTHPGVTGITADGDYIIPFNAPAATARFHLRGWGAFDCDILYCRLVRV